MIKQINPSDTKTRILQVSLNLFSEMGFEKTSIREIAKGVGIKGPSIYNHFISKDEILKSIFSESTTFTFKSMLVNKDNVEALTSNPVEFQNFFKENLKQWLLNKERQKFFKLILTEMFTNSTAKKILLEDILKEEKKISSVFLENLIKNNLIKNLPISKLAPLLFTPILTFELEFFLSVENEEIFIKKVEDHIDFIWDLIKV